MSVSLIVGLLPHWYHVNIGIYPVPDEIHFSNLLETFPGYFLTIFWIFLYVCQSVSWLTSLLKLDKYRHISSFGWDIFPNCFGDIPGMLVHYIQIILNILYVRQSVGWLISLLELYKYRDISSSGWEIFLKCFGYIPGMLVHYFPIILNLMFVCQSVCLLTSLPKLDKGISPDLD